MTSSIGPRTVGGHIATDINNRVHLLQSKHRLALTLPGAMRYFLMNYISEREMKGRSESQNDTALNICGIGKRNSYAI